MQILASTEEAVGRLYEVYARGFPEHEEFWSGLSIEQADQVSAILDLINEVKNGKASFYADSLSISKTEGLLARLDDELKRIKEVELSFIEALSIALDIEKSLVERRFYMMFSSNSAEVRRTLEYLDSTSGNHVKILEMEIKHHSKH